MPTEPPVASTQAEHPRNNRPLALPLPQSGELCLFHLRVPEKQLWLFSDALPGSPKIPLHSFSPLPWCLLNCVSSQCPLDRYNNNQQLPLGEHLMHTRHHAGSFLPILSCPP